MCVQNVQSYIFLVFVFFLKELFAQMYHPSHSFKSQNFKIKFIKLFKKIFNFS